MSEALVLVPGEGEVVGDVPDRRVEVLCDRDELVVTWTRFGPHRDGASPHIHRWMEAVVGIERRSSWLRAVAGTRTWRCTLRSVKRPGHDKCPATIRALGDVDRSTSSPR